MLRSHFDWFLLLPPSTAAWKSRGFPTPPPGLVTTQGGGSLLLYHGGFFLRCQNDTGLSRREAVGFVSLVLPERRKSLT
ncbi:protein of unknown function [Candidatus Methylomirabilis oxygeniifera]|uniref:Uncharacterized protein n=1 Tax=Methylomirabilis oxygeniifera TaxID=671143 RepID=D5MKC3_METO1|nr:protein of unknown function [Candidatus Methylomirabilis oxyfera]